MEQNIFALYGDGSFSTTLNLKDDWVMLIDIGRWLNTIMTNPHTTPDTQLRFGLHWEKYEPEMTGTMLIVDDDWVVHQSTNATQEDYDSVKDGTFGGIMEMTSRHYMTKEGEFKPFE